MGCSWDARSGSSSRHPQWLQCASVRPSATLSCCIVDTPSLWREEKPRAGGDAVSSRPAANASASGTHAAGAIMPGITRDHSGIVDLSEAQDPFTIAADVLDSWSVSNAPRSCARGRVCPRALVFCSVLLDYILAYPLALDLHIWQPYHTR